MAEEKTFEEKLKRVEEISEEMENGEIALEDSMKIYAEAIELIKELRNQIEEARQKLTLLETDTNGNEKMTDFNIGE